jgi:hypothetical protein
LTVLLAQLVICASAAAQKRLETVPTGATRVGILPEFAGRDTDGALFFYEDGKFRMLRRSRGKLVTGVPWMDGLPEPGPLAVRGFTSRELEHVLGHPYKPEGQGPIGVLVGGITSEYDISLKNVERVSACLDQPFIMVNNDSCGMLRDLLQTAGDRASAHLNYLIRKIGSEAGTDPNRRFFARIAIRILRRLSRGVRQLANRHLNPAAETLSQLMVHAAKAHRPLMVLGHSQGGAIVSLASLKAQRAMRREGRHAELTSSLRILTCGGAGQRFPTSVPQVHVATDMDLVSRFLGMGGRGFSPRRGNQVKFLTFEGTPGAGYTQRAKGFSRLWPLAFRRRGALLSNKNHTLKDAYCHILPSLHHKVPELFRLRDMGVRVPTKVHTR